MASIRGEGEVGHFLLLTGHWLQHVLATNVIHAAKKVYSMQQFG